MCDFTGTPFSREWRYGIAHMKDAGAVIPAAARKENWGMKK
jgi:hypothetical protein